MRRDGQCLRGAARDGVGAAGVHIPTARHRGSAGNRRCSHPEREASARDILCILWHLFSKRTQQPGGSAPHRRAAAPDSHLGTSAPNLGAAPIAIRCAKPAGAERRIRDRAEPGRAMRTASQPRAPIAARPGPDAAGVNGSRERHPRALLAHPSPALSAPLRLSESRGVQRGPVMRCGRGLSARPGAFQAKRATPASGQRH